MEQVKRLCGFDRALYYTVPTAFCSAQLAKLRYSRPGLKAA